MSLANYQLLKEMRFFFYVTVMYCGGSPKLVEPRTTSLLKLLVILWQTRSCQNNSKTKVMLTFFLVTVL